jgi:hypothetical protein
VQRTLVRLSVLSFFFIVRDVKRVHNHKVIVPLIRPWEVSPARSLDGA